MFKCKQCGRFVEWADYKEAGDFIPAYQLEEAEMCGPCLAAAWATSRAAAQVGADAAAQQEAAIVAAMAKLPPAVEREYWDEFVPGNRFRRQRSRVVSVHEPVTVDGFTFRPAFDDELGECAGGWELVPEVEPPDGSAFVGERYYRSK